MRKEFYTKRLLIIIIFVLMLLMMCVTFDYAENNTITNIKNTSDYLKDSNITIYNSSSVVNVNDSCSTFVAKSSDKIYTKYPLITITAKPSVRCGYSYKWYTTTWIDYCPHCHRYGVLYNAHKYPARFEQELTCKKCGADYCGVTGKEKYSWSQFYLRGA